MLGLRTHQSIKWRVDLRFLTMSTVQRAQATPCCRSMASWFFMTEDPVFMDRNRRE